MNTTRGRSRKRQDLERIILGLFHEQHVITSVFGLLRFRGDSIKRQGDVGGP